MQNEMVKELAAKHSVHPAHASPVAALQICRMLPP